MEKRKSVSMDAFMGKYAGVYYIKLLLKEPVESRALAIRERLLKRFNEVDDVIEQEGMYSYALCNHKVTYKDDVKVPSQLFITQMIAFDKTTIPELVCNNAGAVKMLRSCSKTVNMKSCFPILWQVGFLCGSVVKYLQHLRIL